MKKASFIVLGLSSLLVGWLLFGQSAQKLILPDVVDGAGWQSTIVLTNITANPAGASLSFNMDIAGGGTQPWTPSFQEVSSTSGLVLAGGSSMYLHTLGTAAALSQGWAELDADAGIVGYVIFTNRVPGRQDQDATAPAVAAANDVLVPYDDANGFVTAIAVVNPNPTPLNISVGFRNASGVAQGALPAVPPMGHMAFALADQFPIIRGHVGLAEFYNATGNFSLISLRFNPTNSSTAAPAFFRNGGAPLIVTPGAPTPTPVVTPTPTPTPTPVVTPTPTPTPTPVPTPTPTPYGYVRGSAGAF